MVDLWVWAVILLFVGMGLILLDIFLPSGGIFAFLAVVALNGAVVMAFMQGPAVGFAVTAGAVLGTSATVILGLQWLPRTAMGRRVLLQPPSEQEVLPDDPHRRELQKLVGRYGIAKSKMLPSGMVSIDGRIYDAVSEGLPVEVGQRVRVIEIRGNRMVVQAVEEDPGAGADLLAQPIDWDNAQLDNPPHSG